MNIAIQKIKRAIADMPTGGMQTGKRHIKLEYSDAQRAIAEIEGLTAERDALAAQVEVLAGHRHELLDLIYNNAIGQVAMSYSIDGEAMAKHAFSITGIDAASTVNSLPPPAAFLAQVRADAGLAGYQACLQSIGYYESEWQDDANAYADSIRQEK